MDLIKETPNQSIVFEDSRVVVALAYEPITKGHCVVIWKNREEDIDKLKTEDYEYLMDVVSVTRDTLKTFYKINKVYLIYFDETNWVHWHLIPAYKKKGFETFRVKPTKTLDFKDRDSLSEIFVNLHNKMMVEE